MVFLNNEKQTSGVRDWILWCFPAIMLVADGSACCCQLSGNGAMFSLLFLQMVTRARTVAPLAWNWYRGTSSLFL
jgi:hypothetical protein